MYILCTRSQVRVQDHFKNLQILYIVKSPQKGRHRSYQRSEGGRSPPSSSTAASSRSSCSSCLSPSMDGGPRDQGTGGEDPWEESGGDSEHKVRLWWTNLDTPIRASRVTKITINDKTPLYSMSWQFVMPDVDLFAFQRKTDWSTLWEHFWGFLRDIWSARDFGSLSMSHTMYFWPSFS